MRVKIINLILLIASWLPAFSLTKDENYGEIEIDNSVAVRSQLRTWRLSLFQIMFGAYKLYILTLSRTYDDNTNKVLYHPKLFKLISLKKIFDKSDHIEQIYDNYYMRLNNSKMTEDRLEKEKESLCYHIEVENSRLEKSDNKMNIYTTVLLTALPILLGISFDSILLLFKTNMIYKAFFIISAYFAMNIVLYLFQYIKVESYNMSSFKDLKNETNSSLSQRLISQYYYDFQSLKNKANLFVSYVKNIQLWMTASFVLFIVVFSFHQFYSYSSTVQKSTVTSNSSIYTMNVTDLSDPYSPSSIKLTDIRKCIQTQSADKVIILYNSQLDITIIRNELQVFDSSFEILYLNDDQLETYNVKILVYKGEIS